MSRLFSSLFVVAFSSVVASCSSGDCLVFDSEDPAVEARLYEYWNLYDANLNSNLDSSLYYIEQVKEIAEAADEKKWIGSAYWGIGYVQNEKGKMGEAVFNYMKAAKVYKELGELSKLASVYNHIGEIYWSAGDLTNGVSYLLKAKDIFEYQGSSYEKGEILRNIAICYREMGEYAKAEEYLQKGLQVVSNSKNYDLVSLTYNSLGALSVKKEEFSEAIEYYERAIQFADSLPGNNHEFIGMALNNIGEAYFKQGNWQLAEKWLKNALIAKKEVNDPLLMQSTYNLLGKLRIAEEKYPEALATIEKGLHEIDLETNSGSAIEEGLSLMNKTLVYLSRGADPVQYAFINKKFEGYSEKLLAYNHRVGEMKDDLEVNNRFYAVQAAAERYAYNEQLLLAKERNTKMKYLFMIPVFLLLGAFISAFIAFRRNRHYKRLYTNIEGILNKSKALRHLPKD